jgi:formylmethanofuran dehydrogenase subunit C
MALVLTQQAETAIPIEVPGITPDQLKESSTTQIAKLPIWHGRNKLDLAELFQISGSMDDSLTMVWEGNLRPVHRIGLGMSDGKMIVEADAGRHVGSQMSGGEITIKGNASDYLGVEMTGGRIRVSGNAGDLVGGHYPGSKIGMNRGTILIAGDVGKGAGQSMRRGTIAIGGTAGELAGWNIRAGTILVFGKCGAHVGTGMIRGTIVLAGGQEQPLLPTFRTGGCYPVPILKLLQTWLTEQKFHGDLSVLQSAYRQFDGDLLAGGRGEVFVRD